MPPPNDRLSLRFLHNGRDRYATPVLLCRQNLPESLERVRFCRSDSSPTDERQAENVFTNVELYWFCWTFCPSLLLPFNQLI